MRSILLLVIGMGLTVLSPSRAPTAAADRWYAVGAAKIDITPQQPTLLAGYGGREGEHVAVETPLWARALAIGQPETALVIAVDNCGVPAGVVQQVATRLHAATGLAPDRLVVASTHTHNAPTLVGYAPIVWQGRATEAEWQRTEQYTAWLIERLVEVGRAALENRVPAQLAWAQGRVSFGGNRRVLHDNRWTGFGHMIDGPVDHSLPVIVARNKENEVVAIWVNYACHCTTLGSPNTIAGDWAGFSNELIEAAFPDAIALTTIGCGADIGPQPSGNAHYARQHGQEIANEVQRLVPSKLKPLSQPLDVQQKPIQLPLEATPSREQLAQTAKGQGFEAEHAKLLLAQLQQNGSLLDHVPYTISTWRFGEELGIVFLPGEVVVDYAVRLKTELDWTRLWINGWSNDVPCYIPSRRLLGEGGYETDFSMIYYGQPARFAPEVEQVLVDAVRQELGKSFAATSQTRPPTFLRPPDPNELFARRLAAWSDAEREELSDITSLAEHSREGFTRLLDGDAQNDPWYDYAGAQRLVHTIRQQVAGKKVRWETSPVGESDERQVFMFLGGLGWQSQPQTEGFALEISGQQRLTFDLVRQPHTWSSEDGRVKLMYFPTWRSDEDTAGLFYLILEPSQCAPGKPCELAVSALGSGSARWFSVHPITNAKDVERIVVQALNAP